MEGGIGRIGEIGWVGFRKRAKCVGLIFCFGK